MEGKRVALVGMGPSAMSYIRTASVMGGRHVEFDEVWTVNNFGSVICSDRIFHMDDVRIQQMRADAGNQQVGELLAWMKKHPGPIYTSRTHPDYPGLVEYPLEDVLNSVGGPCYFDTTPSYMVAFAIHQKVKRIACFGLDYDYQTKQNFPGEKGRSCVEYWLGRAYEQDIEIAVPQDTWLMNTRCNRPYGYDTIDPTIVHEDGKYKVTFTERKQLPTAEEIERRYDHTGKKGNSDGQLGV